MTVVVEIDGKIIVFTKGADSNVGPLLVDQSKEDSQIMEDLDSFAALGLRTLIYAYRELPSGITSKQIKEMSVSELEINLLLLGATGVEDLLQNDVCKCITDFREADC